MGFNPAAEVQALGERPNVKVIGRVPSIVEYLHRAAVCVIPMRVGFGIKNKTLEAMAAGTPVVGSDRAFEGLNVDGDGVPLRALRVGEVGEYVEAISRLFEEEQTQTRAILAMPELLLRNNILGKKLQLCMSKFLTASDYVLHGTLSSTSI